MKFDLIAPCYFGTESTAAFEVRRLGAEDVKVTDGRIAFSGPADIIAAANLNLRCAERVLVLLKTYTATTFDELFDGVTSIPWEELIPADAQFPVKGSSLSSTLSSVPACQSIVKKAVVERLKKGHKTLMLPETGALYKIRFSIRKNVVEVMLDTSGDGLHKRGYRRNATGAPIKGTLAAAMEVGLCTVNYEDFFSRTTMYGKEYMGPDFAVPFTEKYENFFGDGPFDLENRYITEDVPVGCYFMSQLGRKYGVPTPIIDSMILLASTMLKRDLAKESKYTLDYLDIGHMTHEQLHKYLREGVFTEK